MKFSLIFVLLAPVVMSQHQRSREMLWFSPYFQEQAAYNNYQQQPSYDNLQKDVPNFRHFRPTVPLIDSYQNGELIPSIQVIGSPDDQYSGIEDIKSRTNGFNRYSPSLQQARFFYLLNSGANAANGAVFYNPFYKTATFTLTSTLTLATVQSCIAAASFANPPPIPPSCRRRRKSEMSFPYDDSEDQFSLEPSQTQAVTPTVASFSLNKIGWDNSKEILSSDQKVSQEVSSSKWVPALETEYADKHMREKRFFFNSNFVVSTTLTSYVFASATITKTVDLGANLKCIPVGYVVC